VWKYTTVVQAAQQVEDMSWLHQVQPAAGISDAGFLPSEIDEDGEVSVEPPSSLFKEGTGIMVGFMSFSKVSAGISCQRRQ
jgi:hypothetical protein